DCRTADDGDRNVQIPRHAANHMKLLEILLAEKREIGSGLQEQFGDDGGDAIEMTRPKRAAQALADAADRNRGGKTLRIDFSSVRRVKQMRTQWRQLCSVLHLGTRI